MIVSGGNVTIRESTASSRYRGSGGAIYAMNDMIVSGGNVTIRESTAESGGCIYTYGSFEQSNGTVSLQGCTAKHEGGGMLSGNITIEDTAMLTIRDSQADKGGGVFADWITNKAQQLQVSTCSAMSSGGCFYIKDGAEFTAPLLLRDCDAKGTGGAIYAQRKLVAQQINCSRCNAPTSGFLQLESGSASIGSLTLQSSSSLPPASSTVAAGANATVTLGTVDCRQEPGCALVVSRMQLAQLLCHRGESLHTLADDDGAACRECPTNEVRLVAFDKDQNASCTPCPTMENITIFCTSTEMLLPPGYMVDFDRDVASNLSAWYRCPNEMACRGGHFNASSVPGERAQELVPMCQEGYGGPGCTICTEGHARADADILSCVPCANWTTSPKQVVWYVSFFLLKNLALFASAVVSVEGSGGKRATSATLLNQAMSFAAVAGVTMSGAMQTGTFKNDLDHAAQVVLQMLTVPASVAQGQGSSDAGSSSMSGQCLLQLLNVDSSIHHVHMLMSLWPALLVAGLAVIKGGWLAAVVGSNVFLPAFIAGFGKYLVAFRLRPESENEALHLDFLPPGPQMSSHVPLRIAAVLGAIVGFSALSVCSWIYAVPWSPLVARDAHSVRTRSPKETRPHVAYLIQAYRPECAIWEVERLMRKVLLALVATVLPVTLSPALQMEAVTLVLIASLVAHLYFWPYQADDWNRAEIGLLIVSLTITGMTTCLIANDLHWAKSALTQRLLVFLICAIAGGICIVMMVAFAMAYLAERRQRAEAKKAEDASAARKARAGFPVNAANLQQTLDYLTRADLSAAVFVQTQEDKTTRVLRQVVTPGAPTYIYGHELGKDVSAEFSEGRPYIALRLRIDGLLFAEIRPFRREVRFREDVTPEAVEALLADREGAAWPVFVDGTRRSFIQANKWKWFPKQRKWMSLPSEVRDEHFLDQCCRDLCQMLKLQQDPPFVRVRLDTRGALEPLTLSTAKNLGVLKRDGVPSLVAAALPLEAPASARRLLKRWLLAPRCEETVHAMRQLLAVFLSSQAISLPALSRVPPVAKVIAYITARTASERLFRDVAESAEGIQSILDEERYGPLWPPVLKIVAADTGSAFTREALQEDLADVRQVIQRWLHDPSTPDEPGVQCEVSEDADTQRAVDRYFEANENFRGVASQEQEHVFDAYSRLQRCRADLLEALKNGLHPEHRDALVYHPFDNDLCFKQKPPGESRGAIDRKGKAKKDRYTTQELQAAHTAYLAAAKAAENAVQQALQLLCVELSSHVETLRGTICAAEVLLLAYNHAAHAAGRGWTLPEISDNSLSCTLFPYWMHPSDAVFSHVALGARGAIATGPNMSGKSTLMRAIGASALLSSCGFLVPCLRGGAIPRYRQVSFVSAEGDRPAEGVSAFGQEALVSATVLRRAGPRTLALVDEFGRGTEPRAAKAAVCALIEELLARDSQFVVATHLHEIADEDFSLPDRKLRPASWRMGVRQTADGALQWTYKLEEGVCRDSFAGETLRHFGWEEEALGRFYRHMGRYMEPTSKDPQQASGLQPSEGLGEEAVALPTELSTEISSMMAALDDSEPPLRLGPTDAPPAKLSAGKAALYAQLGSFFKAAVST
ncbi:MSH1 [Symbiodinium sp. CCMP2592]|nr:MSH1 [Symbiodinium sp. CCMP2592]